MKRIATAITVLIAVLIFNTCVFASDSPKEPGNTGAGNQSTEVTATVIKAPLLNYTDIAGHWAQESINKMADPALFADKDGKFHPETPVTRREFARLLHQRLGIRIIYLKATDIKEFFSDVSNEDTYASDLYDLVVANIIDYKGAFKPDSIMTREEMVHFFLNAYKYKMGEGFRQIKLSSIPFQDNEQINIIYRGEITRAEYEGLIKRPADGRFHPADPATRAQAATVCDRLLKLLEREKSQVAVTPSVQLKDGTLIMSLTIRNNSDSKITISHSSGQKFDFSVLDAGRKSLYTWSADKMFLMGLTETVIEPGKTMVFSDTLDKDAYSLISDKAVYLRAYITGTSKSFTVDSDGYETRIR